MVQEDTLSIDYFLGNISTIGEKNPKQMDSIASEIA